MIVCVCRGLNEAQVRTLIQSGSDSLERLAATCGAGTSCGSCAESLCCLLDAAKRQELPRQPTVGRIDQAGHEDPRPPAHRRLQGADHEVPPSRADR